MYQEVNPLFEIFFLAVLLASLVIALLAAIALLRRLWSAALARLQLLLLIDSVYLALVLCSSLALPGRILNPGDLDCFDDWCVTAQKVEYRSSLAGHPAKGMFALVHLKVVSQARWIYQAEKLARAELGDDHGVWRLPSTDAQKYLNAALGAQPALAQRLGPGESFSTVLAFDVPADTRSIALRMNHNTGPGCLIIGESHLLRSGTEFRFGPQAGRNPAEYNRVSR